MPDISMCKNKECPSREKCYRYMAIPSDIWQSYADFKVPARRKKCADFMIIYDRRIRPVGVEE